MARTWKQSPHLSTESKGEGVDIWSSFPTSQLCELITKNLLSARSLEGQAIGKLLST